MQDRLLEEPLYLRAQTHFLSPGLRAGEYENIIKGLSRNRIVTVLGKSFLDE